MSQPTDFITISSYVIAVVALTAVLIWGLRNVSRELSRKDPSGDKTFLAEALSEKNGASDALDDKPAEPSFSRVAGALGAVGLAATVVAIGYWVVYQLYFGTDLDKITKLSTYFLAGSALFIPYGFNKISSIFK